MAPAKGNKHAVKLISNELKIEAYKDYCDHIAAGKSKKGWRYKDKTKLLCTWQTMEKYMEEMPDVLDPIHKALADCDSYSIWEKKGEDMMEGTVKCFEPAIYQMFMRNKFDWDKKESDQEKYQPSEPLKITIREVKDAGASILTKASDKSSSSDEEA